MTTKRRVLIALLCALLAASMAVAAGVSGVVYEDVNGNGVQDEGENGLQGVYISDGEHIVAAGQNGAYTIQVTEAVPSWVNVTIPDGYRATSPFYWTVAGDNPSLNFGLQSDPLSTSSSFSFIHGADIQYPLAASISQLQYDFNTMEQLANQQDVRFYTCVGDLTENGATAELNALKQTVSTLGRPFFAQFGGHDGLVAMDRPMMGNYVDVMGPYSYSWNYGGVHFVSLVSEDYFLSNEEQTRQASWLAADLATQSVEKPIVVLCHTPEGMEDEINAIGDSRNLIAVLRGHYHIHELTEVGDTPVLCSGPWRSSDWGAFTKRVRVVSMEDGALTSTSTRVLGEVKKMTILSPTQSASCDSLSVAANIYDTVLVPDNVAFEITGDQPGQHWTGNLTQQSDWTWTGDVPEQLPAGTYQVTVTASANGENWSSQRQFSVEPVIHTPSPGADWASVLGAQSGRRAAGGATPNPSNELRLAWIRPTGTSLPYFSSPAIASGRVYLGLSDGEIGHGNAGVICIAGETGNVIWRRDLPSDVLASVCVEGGNVFALTNQGTLLSLDGATGDILWSKGVYEGTSLFGQGQYDFRMNMAPVTADNGVVYVAAQGTLLAAYQAATGQRVWCNTSAVNSGYQLAGVGIGEGILFALDESKYVGIDPATGNKIWQQDIDYERGTATPIYANGAVYMNYAGYLIKANPADGSEIWKVDTVDSRNYMGIPAIADGKVVISKAGLIAAFDDLDGDLLWEFNLRTTGEADIGAFQLFTNGSSAAIYEDCVFVGGDDGYFYVLDLDTGQKEWEYRIGTPIKASPAVSGNMVYVSAFDGNVYGFVIAPEPATVVLLLGGTGLAALQYRRRCHGPRKTCKCPTEGPGEGRI